MSLQPLPSLLLIVRAEEGDDWFRSGTAAGLQGDWSEAAKCFSNGLLLDPACVAAVNNLGVAYARLEKLNEALLTFRRAAALLGPETVNQEEAAAVRANLAVLAAGSGWFDFALETVGQVLQGSVGPQVKFAAALVHAAAGQIGRSLELYKEVLVEYPSHQLAGRNIRFMQTLTDCGPEELAKQGRAYHERLTQLVRPQSRPHHSLSLNGKPLRVGYVSGDFRSCSPAFIFAGVVLHHSSAVVPYLYSTSVTDPELDTWTEKFQRSAGDRWRDISRLGDAEAEDLIRSDRIDVLVDLDGHSGALVIRSSGGRLSLFLHRPAPVQVTAWGFAHGTSCPEIDYFFADPVAVPEEERVYYTERVVDLPCIVTYEFPEYDLPGASDPPVARNGYFTFGCFSRFEKLSDSYLATVREVLLTVPESRLLLKDGAFSCPYMIEHVRSRLGGIERNRLLFAANSFHPAHLWCCQQCDLMLDPFPHSGGTAALEQLWAGVPIITIYGRQAAGRTTASILTCVGRAGWVTRTREEYAALAVRLASTENGKNELSSARGTLRRELEDSPVVRGYVAAVEEKYRWMIQEKLACATTK